MLQKTAWLDRGLSSISITYGYVHVVVGNAMQNTDFTATAC